ncbi:hypothetical protein BJ912DRAFT_1148562 [Pholiota molesta]|nr:hypothetical protein BJ912DRAFT_1148562 [Pholiota molesta]
MHFTKFITAFIVAAAATSACASPSFRPESAELGGGGGMEIQGASLHHHHGGGSAFASDADTPAEQFSEAPESPLQTASRAYCWYGRCLHRHYRWRRCPRGSRAVRYVDCGYGYWWVSAVCCLNSRCLTGATDETAVDGEGNEVEGSGFEHGSEGEHSRVH